MLRTIFVSDYIHVQGTVVRALDDGDIVICTGNREFLGRPISPLSPFEMASPTAVRTAGVAG